MKVLLLVVVFSSLCAIALGLTCGVVTCVGLGQSCLRGDDTVNHYAYPLCNDGLTCNTTSSSAQVCTSLVPAGGNCGSPGAQCVDNYWCPDNVCVLYTAPAAGKQGGQACGSNDMCTYPTEYGTESYPCPASGVCPGNTTGNACATFNFQPVCNGGLYCRASDSTCVPLAANGASCTNDVGCTSGRCIPVNSTSLGTCGNFNAVAANGYCTDGNDCGADLYCNRGFEQTSYGQCIQVQAPSGKACSSNSDCTATNEECQCRDDGSSACGLINSPSLHSSLAPLLACVASSGCSQSDGACWENHCLSQYCAYSASIYGYAWSDNYVAKYPCEYGSDAALYAKCKASSSDASKTSMFAAGVVIAAATILL